MKNMKSARKSMRVLITILISLVCINGALMVATIFANADVVTAASEDKTVVSKSTIVTKINEVYLEKMVAEKKAQTKKAATTQTTATTTTSSTSGTASSSGTAATKVSGSNTTSTNDSTPSSSGLSTLRGSVNKALISAFDELEFVIKINPNSTYLGYFSTSKHSVEMREASVSTFRHEMGHFLDVLKNMPSRSSEFSSIYSKEKSKYSGSNYSYVTKNAQEYFAQSYRNYLENSSKLKSERPLTYEFVKAQVGSISSSDITRTYNMYSWAW